MHAPTATDTAASTTERTLEIASDSRVALHAELQYAADPRMVYVRYRLRNDSADRPIAVFDRGVYGDWAGGLYAPGPVGRPRFEHEGDTLTLAHVAVPPAADDHLKRSAPLALAVAAGAIHADEFAVTLPSDISPTRLRWCVGVATFEADDFRTPKRTERGDIWVADGDAIARQSRLCTPWYDVAAAKFVD